MTSLLRDLDKLLGSRLATLISNEYESAAAASSGFGANPHDNRFIETNLVSDGLEPAANIDPKLINPWGVAESPTGPFWVSDNGSGLSTLYSSNGTPQPLVVTIAVPPGQATPAGVTGQVFNSFGTSNPTAFVVDGKPASFIFATEDGTISAWNAAAGKASVLMVDNSSNPFEGTGGHGAVYTGLAIASSGQGPTLYAANFNHGTVDVFNGDFQQIGSFTDTSLPKGYAPYNVQELNGSLYVTFAKQDATQTGSVSALHAGYVDQFSLNGALIARVGSGGPLDAPWGLAIAPSSFGAFAGDLLVGNFGSGQIDAYNPKTSHFDGAVRDQDGKPLVIGDLWSLSTGNGGNGGSASTVYFTAGVQNEAHGLFGALNLAPNLTKVA